MGPSTAPPSIRSTETFFPSPHRAFKWALALMNVLGLTYLILFLGFGKQLHLSTLATIDYISMNFLFPIGFGILIGGAIIWGVLLCTPEPIDPRITYPRLGWLLGFFVGPNFLSLLHDHHIFSLVLVESTTWFWLRIVSLVAYATYMIYFSLIHQRKEPKPEFSTMHFKT